jgi:hypothetical protein
VRRIHQLRGACPGSEAGIGSHTCQKAEAVMNSAGTSRSHRRHKPAARRAKAASSSLALAECGQRLILFLKPVLWGCAWPRQPLKSSGPTLFGPSLKVERDGTHYPPSILLLRLLNAPGPQRVRGSLGLFRQDQGGSSPIPVSSTTVTPAQWRPVSNTVLTDAGSNPRSFRLGGRISG